MLRSSIAIAVAALTLLSAGACNRPQTPAPTQQIDSAPLMKTLGTASVIPLLLCRGIDTLPLHMAASFGPPRDASHPLRVSLITSNRHRVSCVPPPDIQQDNAVPLTRVNGYVEF